jgi:prepilin-type N-terminal cleavage/methylation domain-containing protein
MIKKTQSGVGLVEVMVALLLLAVAVLVTKAKIKQTVQYKVLCL